MYKSIIAATALLLFVGCSEEKNQTMTSVTPTPEKIVVDTQTMEPVVVQEELASATPAVESTVAPSAPNGATLYAKKCASCHGPKAELSALGASAVIATWEPKRISDALHGYKNGTYGREKKAVMVPQTRSLDEATIEALATFIAAQQ
ncbi:MAG: hypothetical protein KU28_01725 [Sulfurovum sp. PC08-66]|nr:MAG: hypothetical protein KU28_01725 [Sulfurovum sp. PC08-66]KIM12655.1 MAG: hypothetical protein KU37_01830 [Sulfuricurvum sp. PC08-66]